MEHQRNQFDEQAALQALERLRDQIESARSRREQKIAEFDAFVRANRAASQAERLAALNEREAGLPPVQGAARSADRAADSYSRPHSRSGPAYGESEAPPRLEPFEPFQSEPRHGTIAGTRSFWSDRRVHIAAGVLALLLLVLFLAPWGDDVPEPQAVPTATGSPSPATPGEPAGDRAQPSSAAPAAETTRPGGPAAPAAASRPLVVEVTTLRPVWMRVVVDGERRVERQVPADQTLTYGADRVVALRVGDAGAVRLTVDGVDRGVLGRDGQVVNRTFTPRPR